MKKDTYIYKGFIERVLDANTIEIRVDLGFDVSIKRVFAVLDMKAPTFQGAQGDQEQISAAEAAKRVAIDLAGHRPCVIKTEKLGRYGRYAADVWFEDGTSYVSEVGNAIPK